MAGTQHLNLMQQMYYNGYYKVHFAEAQHLFQADGMVDSLLHCVFTTIVTDKAYGRTAHLQPIFTEAGLHLIGPQQLAICIKIDKCNHKLRLSVEKSFNHQDTKFNHCDHIQSKK